ncbi:hypothetical protein J2739_005329 [Variovorax soli]|uniref:Uncharacterized protein n=1 Tax=Variovorax soli TaxID=376815 RepID=A0ABU1NM60_9BURK|nr:hypothetical protein [Variovorax soli]
MDMISRIRRLHVRDKLSERESAHDGAVAQHGLQVAARTDKRDTEVPA